MPTEMMEAPAIEPEVISAEDISSESAADHEASAEPAVSAEPAENVEGDERTLPARIKNLKAIDPKAYREAANDFFGRRALQAKLKDFDLDKTRTWLEENGGIDGIEMSRTEAQSKAQELDALNDAFAQGDTGFIDKIAQSEGFSKIAFAAIDKAAQVDPDGWNSKMSGVFNATIAQSELPKQLERIDWNINLLSDMLGAIPEVANNTLLVRAFNELAQQFGGVKTWTQSFKGGQQAAPGQPQQARPGEQTAAQVREEIANTTFRDNYNKTVNDWRSAEIKKELKPYLDGRKDSPEKEEALETAMFRITSLVRKQMEADKDTMGKLNAHGARKDLDGALRLTKSRETKAIQEIATKIGRSVFGNPKPKEEPKPVVVAARASSSTPKKVDPFDAIYSRA